LGQCDFVMDIPKGWRHMGKNPKGMEESGRMLKAGTARKEDGNGTEPGAL